jgi:leucyl-tRNA synthetase
MSQEEGSAGAVADQMASMAIGAGVPAAAAASKGTAKRDALRSNEIAVQQMWSEQRVFESDPDPSKPSFLVTFPYPYANGHLHIGHAFSMTKAIFRAQFERHQGKNVLFPFAFHCTGMPIQAVRDYDW